MRANSDAALRSLQTEYEPTNWIAVFLRSYETGCTAQPAYVHWLSGRLSGSGQGRVTGLRLTVDPH